MDQSDLRHVSGKLSQEQRPPLATVADGAARGCSTKQPPAIPVCSGMAATFQRKVVPQLAQNHRC